MRSGTLAMAFTSDTDMDSDAVSGQHRLDVQSFFPVKEEGPQAMAWDTALSQSLCTQGVSPI